MQKIDRNWYSRYRPHLLTALILVVLTIVAVTFLKGCSAIGHDSRKDVYTPSADNGFIYKANQLLSEIVEDAKKKHPGTPQTLQQLNRKYGALSFELPYNYQEAAGGRASDIRLVRINPDSIRSASLRQFYYNSDLPALLEKQRQNLGERIFNIKFERGGLEIKSIRLMPSMFKLALEKDPWQGSIMARENSLFPESSYCFLTWGMNMLPIRQNSKSNGDFIITADLDGKRFRRLGKTVDYYDCWKHYQSDSTKLIINLGKNGNCLKLEYIAPTKVRIKAEGSISCSTLDSIGQVHHTAFSEAGKGGEVHDFRNDLKLIVTDTQGAKITEFVLTHHNPMLNLSMVISTDAGKMRYFENRDFTDRFTQQIIRGLSSSMRNTLFRDTVQLSIDPLLSVAFEQELRNYCENVLRKAPDIHASPADQWELSMTVMDMATGQVIAAPYYRTEDSQVDYEVSIGRKNPALLRRYVGSAFKPLLALAAVQSQPALMSLSTIGKYSLDGASIQLGKDGRPRSGKARFYGTEIDAWALSQKTRGFWVGCPSMGQFLAHSDDVYPVALSVLSLAGQDGKQSTYDFSRSSAFSSKLLLEKDPDRVNWTEQPLIKNLGILYDLKSYNDLYADDSLKMSHYIWRSLPLQGEDQFGLDNINPDVTVMHYQKLYDQPHKLKTNLVPWILGQGTNEWNCVKLAEAWTRMLTKREVRASFIDKTTQSPTLVKPLKSNLNPDPNDVWNQFLDALLYAQSHSPGLLTPMDNAVKKLGHDMLLFSKTGTPNNYDRPEWKTLDGRSHWLDVGLYCMGLMPSASYQQVRQQGEASGVVCILRITRITRQKPSDDGVSSIHARNFFSASSRRLQKFYDMTRLYY